MCGAVGASNLCLEFDTNPELLFADSSFLNEVDAWNAELAQDKKLAQIQQQASTGACE